MENNYDYFMVTVEDKVIQVTAYLVHASDKEHARQLVAQGIYAFESEREVIDTIETEVKSVEALGV